MFDSTNNMIAQSQSGTGKTAAFVLTMLSRVDATKDYPQVQDLRYQLYLFLLMSTIHMGDVSWGL